MLMKKRTRREISGDGWITYLGAKDDPAMVQEEHEAAC